jgi:hypothetical protein
MSTFFLDSSALTKRYLTEIGVAARLEGLTAENPNQHP